MVQKLFRSIFWSGYISVLISAFIQVGGNLNKIRIGPELFKIRLDHLLHFAVYLFICIYYLAGQLRSLNLFTSNPLKKFILLLLFLAIVTEVVQLWVPERTFNVLDLASNVGGVVVGVGVIRIEQRCNGIKGLTAE